MSTSSLSQSARNRKRQARDELSAKLDLMAEHVRNAEDWVEPTPQETAEDIRELGAWFRRHG